MDISLPSAYEITDDGYKRPTKPITEWTKEELDKYLANLDKRREKRLEAFSKLSPEEQAAVSVSEDHRVIGKKGLLKMRSGVCKS